MDCIKKCVEGFSGGENEFGNLAYSPISLSEIRERQEWNDSALSYTIGSEAKGPITLNYAYLCQRGLYPDDPDKENQDAFKIAPAFDGEQATIMMGVFDGHGEYGDDCSTFVRENIVSYLSEARKEHNKDLEKAFRSAFRKLNSAMHYCKARAAPRPPTPLVLGASALSRLEPAPPPVRRTFRTASRARPRSSPSLRRPPSGCVPRCAVLRGPTFFFPLCARVLSACVRRGPSAGLRRPAPPSRTGGQRGRLARDHWEGLQRRAQVDGLVDRPDAVPQGRARAGPRRWG